MLHSLAKSLHHVGSRLYACQQSSWGVLTIGGALNPAELTGAQLELFGVGPAGINHGLHQCNMIVWCMACT